MFDVGFWEVSLIAIVALVVVGPERLPRLARTVGLYVGKARRVLRDVRSEIDREINRAELGEIKDLKDTVTEAKSQIDRATADVSKTLNENVMASSDPGNDGAADATTTDGGGGNAVAEAAAIENKVSENTIHQNSETSVSAVEPEAEPASQSSMPPGLRAASMSAGAASASSAMNAASEGIKKTVAGDNVAKEKKPTETGALPIPPDSNSEDDY